MDESMLCTKTHEYLLEKGNGYEIGITEIGRASCRERV